MHTQHLTVTADEVWIPPDSRAMDCQPRDEFPCQQSPVRLSRRICSVQQSLVGWKQSMNTHGWGAIVFRVLSATEGLYLINDFQTMWELLKTWGKAVKNWKYVCTFSGRYWKGVLSATQLCDLT